MPLYGQHSVKTTQTICQNLSPRRNWIKGFIPGASYAWWFHLQSMTMHNYRNGRPVLRELLASFDW